MELFEALAQAGGEHLVFLGDGDQGEVESNMMMAVAR